MNIINFLETERKTDHICCTEDGYQLVKDGVVDFDFLSQILIEPNVQSADMIGRGTEGNCFLFELNGIKMVIKVYNEEMQKMVNQFSSMFRIEHEKPIFSKSSKSSYLLSFSIFSKMIIFPEFSIALYISFNICS